MRNYTIQPDDTITKHLNYLPANYGGKRDFRKIDLYLDGIYYGSTNWAYTLTQAIHALAAKIIATNGTKISAEFSK